jgi:hypothetical protein
MAADGLQAGWLKDWSLRSQVSDTTSAAEAAGGSSSKSRKQQQQQQKHKQGGSSSSRMCQCWSWELPDVL